MYNNEHILSNNQEKNKEGENNILDFMDLDEDDDNNNQNNIYKNGRGDIYLESQDNDNLENDFVEKIKHLEKKCHIELKKKIKKKDIEDIRFNIENLYNKMLTSSNLENRTKMKVNSKKNSKVPQN